MEGVSKMIKNKDQLIEEKKAELEKILTKYVDDMDKLSDTSEFTIDNLESMWEEVGIQTKEIYNAVNKEILNRIDEREMISQKKANI